MPVVNLNYEPRPHAVEIHRGMDTHRFGAVVAHRRFGKTVCAVLHLVVCCLENKRAHPVPRYAFIAPFLGQAKTAAWEYLTYYTQHIPGAVAIPMLLLLWKLRASSEKFSRHGVRIVSSIVVGFGIVWLVQRLVG